MQVDDSFSTTEVRGQWEDSFCQVVLRDVTSNESLDNITECMIKDQQKGNLDYLRYHFLIKKLSHQLTRCLVFRRKSALKRPLRERRRKH